MLKFVHQKSAITGLENLLEATTSPLTLMPPLPMDLDGVAGDSGLAEVSILPLVNWVPWLVSQTSDLFGD